VDIPTLIKARDAARAKYVQAKQDELVAYEGYETAQAVLAEAINLTGSLTYVEPDGTKHIAVLHGASWVHTMKEYPDA
jgi:hypothetical protein